MQLQPVFGKSILLGGICWLLSGCAMTGLTNPGFIPGRPNSGGSVFSGAVVSRPAGVAWEDPCSPEWPAACMPGPVSGPPAPLLSCLARLPHREGLPEAPPYPRFHPLPTRPMLSPRSDFGPPQGSPALESFDALQATGAASIYGAIP